MSRRKKIILTCLAAAGLLFLYAAIFVLSDEDAQQSAERSEKLTRHLVKFYYWLVGSGETQRTGAQVSSSVSAWDGRIRELAHFMEYFGVGFLSYGILMLWHHPVWRGRLIILIQLLISAGADEINQLFSPGRSASVEDVLVDMAGGLIGLGVMLLCVQGYRWYARRVNSDNKRSSP